MTNVGELWRNVTAATGLCGILLYFASAGSFLSFVIGLGYAAFFEYFYHRCIGHTNLFPLAAEKHREHHREWRGSDSVSMDRTKKNLNESWYFFPGALLAHFLIPSFLGYTLPWTVVLAFTLFYLQFEVFHWATHAGANWIDDLILAWPVIGALREEHIDWHLEHHEKPKEKYNFTPPYVGDIVFSTVERDT